MPGDLITLPLRLSVRAASLLLRATEEVAKRAISLAGVGTPVGTATWTPPQESATPAHEPEMPAREAAPRAEREPPPAEAEPPVVEAEEIETPHDDTGPFPTEPTHVSEEAVIVEQLAEPGAEDGAGAEVRIEEPWEGYAHTSAKDVIARLDGASAAELAAVDLYESANRARQSVLTEVERQLELSRHRGSPE